MKTLTVFTPTYNRAKMLLPAYEALKKQTSKDFLWLIIDDGSTDNTEEVVNKWIDNETSFEIQYFKKENGGLHTGYNKAIELAKTELMVCIDSDDYMPEYAVEHIINTWKKIKNQGYAGIIALDAKKNGETMSGLFPNIDRFNLIKNSFGEYDFKSGDVKLVVRTDLYKSVAPMPSFEGEKNFNPQLLHLKICLNYDFYPVNEVYCIVDYQEDGMSNTIYRQFYDSPNSFAEYRKFQLSIPNAPLKFLFRYSIHYVSSCIFAKKKIFQGINHKFLVLLSVPFGILENIFVRKKVKDLK